MMRVTLIVLTCVMVACGSSTAPSAPALLTITPGTNLLMIGSTETFLAFAASTAGTGASVTASWTTDNPAVATVTAQGVATALSPGAATITASYQGLSASRALRVSPSYAGSWSGGYRTTACSSSDPVYCAFNHAPGATIGQVAVFLSQLGDQVSGFVFLDNTDVPVSGTIAMSGDLSLQGEVNSPAPMLPSYVGLRIENWTSSIDVASRLMVGRFTHLHAEGTPAHPLSNRVESELLNVKPIGPP